MTVQNLLTRPTRTPLVAASILAADFAAMGREARSVLDAGADLIHFDVMDGHFVKNLTMGPDMCRSLRGVLPDALFDVHLMVSDPAQFVEAFAEAGANHLTLHAEAVPAPGDVVAAIHDAGLTAGVAINPGTGVEALDPVLGDLDLVLVMSVEPGYAGQPFIPGVLAKAEALKPRLRPDQRLQIDGGLDATTARAARRAGCDVIVAASGIFNQPDYAEAIAALRGAGVLSGSD